MMKETPPKVINGKACYTVKKVALLFYYSMVMITLLRSPFPLMNLRRFKKLTYPFFKQKNEYLDHIKFCSI